MITVVESTLFTRLWPDYWSEAERGEFAAWIAANPEAGDVVPASGGVRKVRWASHGSGKRGGVRVIYFNRPRRDEIWLLTLYAKSARDNLPAHLLKQMREIIESE